MVDLWSLLVENRWYWLAPVALVTLLVALVLVLGARSEDASYVYALF